MLKQEGLITTKVTPKPLNFIKCTSFDQIYLTAVKMLSFKNITELRTTSRGF